MDRITEAQNATDGTDREWGLLMASPATASPVNEVVEFFAHAPSRQDIAVFRLSSSAQERLSGLLARNAAGTLSVEEQHELDQMVLLDDIVSLIRARAQGSTSASA
jgi:hypothetical protein